MSPPPVRLADLAARLGCDKSTVSLALRGSREVSAATRARVRALARELGYRPHPGFRRLAAQRWAGREGPRAHALALVQRGPRMGGRLPDLLRAAAERLGYGWEHVCLDDYPSGRAAAKVLIARGVRGVVAAPVTQRETWGDFPWGKFAVVQVMEGSAETVGRAVFRQDAFGPVLDGAEHLRRAGASSLAFLWFPLNKPSATDDLHWAASLHVAERWRAAGLRAWPPVAFPPGGVEMHRAMARWIKQERPDGVIVQNAALTWALEELGLKPGREFQGVALYRGGEKAWAGFERLEDRIVESAVSHLDHLVRHDELGSSASPAVTVLPARWFDGPSLRCT